MGFHDPPTWAAWRHHPEREGFEVVFVERLAQGWHVHGTTTGVEDDVPVVVEYRIEVDAGWRTRRAEVRGTSRTGGRSVLVEGDGNGHWTVDGKRRPELDGCADVDVETSCFTNTFPVHRLGLAVGEAAEAPAAYVRGEDLAVLRLEQTYRRRNDRGAQQRYDYASPTVDFACRLTYDESGLVLDYPRVGTRAG